MASENLNAVNALFMPAWNDVTRKAKKPTESDQQKAREAFYKAVRSCDKATETMVDKHLENVAESAKKLAEYRKRKAVEDRVIKEADMRRNLRENMLLARINHHNLMEETRIRELNRQELLENGI
jgi:histone H3/H4